MSDNTDHTKVMSEAIATIPPWRTFLQRKRAEVQAQVAQMQAPPSSADAPTVLTPSLPLSANTAPITAEREADAETIVVDTDMPAEDEGRVLMAQPPVTPSATTPTPSTEQGEVKGGDADTATASTPPSTPAPDVPIKVPVTLQSAWAQLEAVLTEAGVDQLPEAVQAAWHNRVHQPERVAQLLIGVAYRGNAPEGVAAAVEMLIEVDPYFKSQYQLYEMDVYPAAFDVNGLLNDEEKSSTLEAEPTGQGEADQAVERDESPF